MYRIHSSNIGDITLECPSQSLIIDVKSISIWNDIDGISYKCNDRIDKKSFNLIFNISVELYENINKNDLIHFIENPLKYRLVIHSCIPNEKRAPIVVYSDLIIIDRSDLLNYININIRSFTRSYGDH